MNVVLSRPTPGASPPFKSAFQEVEYLKATDELHSEVAKLSGFLMMSRLVICWYTIIIMIGDFDFAELGAEHPLTAVLWFWTYMILVALIMLNMLLAIIMDVYTEVKTDASEQDPIWTQFSKVLSDAWNHRDWIKLKTIVDQVHNLPVKVTQLDKDLLLEMLPDMIEGQALALIEETVKNEENEEGWPFPYYPQRLRGTPFQGQ